MIAQRSIKPGNFVQINTPIFRIVDTSRLEATLNVPERELETLKAGLPVLLQVDALPGKTFTGWKALFAGGFVRPSLHPLAIKAMAKVGIDISGRSPKSWTDEIVRAANR